MNKSRTALTRRQFLRRSALVGGAITFGAYVRPIHATPRKISPHAKLNIAVIGASGRGGTDAQEVSSENIVALCDVNETNLNIGSKKFPNARRYYDFRK